MKKKMKSFRKRFDSSVSIVWGCCCLVIWLAGPIAGQSYYSSSFRFRCPTIFPTRSQLSYSNAVILTGLVEEVRPVDNDDFGQYLATVLVRRVLHGSRGLQQNRIQVTGFDQPKTSTTNEWCYPNARQGETWIFTLQPISMPDYFRLNSSLIKVTLNNLEKLDAIISDQPYSLRLSLQQLPCEKKYCKNNANCVEDSYSSDGARCECLTNCKSKYAPVCGSDDETYNNECELRMQSCRAEKNLFVKFLNSCYYYGSSAYNRGQSTPSSSGSYGYRQGSGSSSSSSSSLPSPPFSPSSPSSTTTTYQRNYYQSNNFRQPTTGSSYSNFPPLPPRQTFPSERRPSPYYSQYPTQQSNNLNTYQSTRTQTTTINRSFAY